MVNAKGMLSIQPLQGPDPRANVTALDFLLDHLRGVLASIEDQEGEITDEQARELDTGNASLDLTAEAYNAICCELDARADACEAVADTYYGRARKLRGRSGFLKYRLQRALEDAGREVAAGATGGARLRAATAHVELTCAAEDVPNEYCEVARTVSRKRIAQAIREGVSLPWAKLVKGRYLQWVR